MADLVMNLYLNGGKKRDDDDVNDDDNNNEQSSSSYDQTDGDVFSRLALDVSTCQLTREDSGEIGWVDNPKSTTTTKKTTLNDV